MMPDSTAPCPGTKKPPLFAAGSKVVARERRAGLDLVVAGSRDCRQFDLALRPLPGEDAVAMLRRLSDVLQEYDAVPVLQFVFGALESLRTGEEAINATFGKATWPVTWAEGAGCAGGIAGMQVLALSKRPIKPLRWKDRVVGSIFEDGSSRHCVLGGLGPESIAASRADQTGQTLELLERLLESDGFRFSEIMRTWFYLQDILSWYDDFNKVRTAFYKRHRFNIGATPASTGVSGNNPTGAALALAAWAVQPLHKSFKVAEIISPLQCPAPAYGSSFSRAVEFSTPYGRRLLVSGTASIEPGGKTVWIGDLRRQIELTMQVVEAILRSRGMELGDATRATVYFKRPEFAPAFNEWCAAHNLAGLPAVLAHCDICRDDLLFEIELDAVSGA